MDDSTEWEGASEQGLDIGLVAWYAGCSQCSRQLERRSHLGSTDDAIAFVHKVNKDRALQARVGALRPRDWASLFALAAELGYEVNLETFYYGCLSDKVVRFCPVLAKFAGQLYSYKM